MQDLLRLSLEEHLTRVCGSDEAFLGKVSGDLALVGDIDGDNFEDDDIFSICHFHFNHVRNSVHDQLLSILLDDLHEFERITEAEVITLCKHVFNDLVDIFTRRIDLCILHFPDAKYSEKSREALENTFDAIIDFDVGDLNELKDSFASKGTTADIYLPAHYIESLGTRPLDSNPNSPTGRLPVPPHQLPNFDRLSGSPPDNQPDRPPGPPVIRLGDSPPDGQPDRPPGPPHSAHPPADLIVDEEIDLSASGEQPKEHIGDSSKPSSKTKECHEAQRQQILERRRIWNHMTISRDHTSTSNFTREFLATLFGVKTKQKDYTEEKVIIGELAVAETNIQHTTIDQQRMAVDQQARRRHQHMLGQQSLRLDSLRKNRLQKVMDPFPGKSPLIEAESPRHTAALQDGRGSDITNSRTNSNNILDRIATLERENQELKRTQTNTFRCEKLYFIPSEVGIMPTRPGGAKAPGVMMCYLDEPTWATNNMGGHTLRCNLPVNDINGFLRKRSDIIFVVAYHYTPGVQEAEVAKAILTKKDLPRPIPTSEFITLHDKTLIAAMEEFLSMQPNFQENFPNLNIRGQIPAPYLFWYQYRSSNALERLNQTSRELMNFFTSWIDEHYSQKFALAEDHLSRRVISEETMPFLVKPGDVLVWEQRRKIYAVVAKDWLKRTSSPRIHQINKEREMNWSKTEASSNIVSTRWSTDGWHFEFDGEFHRKTMGIDVNLRFDESEEEISIDKLTKYPLRFASSRIEARLKRRGTIFWRCRNQHLVSYEDEDTGHTNGERFMIDYKTYQQLHASSATVTARVSKVNNDTEDSEKLSLDVMADDDPPPSPDIYVFPDKIPGYNLHTKKWVDLSVDRIQDVEWNKESFKHLVVEPNTKELIQALVRHQIASEQGTDIVNRKGNGLIILLHGGPGTGKTFTAESVAEMAEKPLFRVTCGDIGTKPEDVEKYLESVLYLGKIWSCIVLIDEAEVFLEQRSLDNLERNALVSVFLRVLEYYEGILILTSNRVGTFDEAFKSRILLSLHYENLNEGQRTQIWKNMFKRLEKISKSGTGEDVASKTEPGSRKRKAMDESITGIDFDEVNCYITELAKQDLNGRQIRNTITTARQLATFRETQMRYEHLQHVIAVSSKFDTYLKKLQEGFSDDQIARDEGFR